MTEVHVIGDEAHFVEEESVTDLMREHLEHHGLPVTENSEEFLHLHALAHGEEHPHAVIDATVELTKALEER